MQRRPLLVALSGAVTAPWWPALALAGEKAYRRRVLRDHHDRETSLAAEASGDALVVVVMKGYWCRVCIGQLQRLEQLRPRLSDRKAVLVGLNADSPAQNRQMVEAEKIECPVLSDERHEVIAELGLWLPRAQEPLPALVVFDRCGDEAARWVGRQPGDRPESAVLRVLQKLKETNRICDRPNV